MNPQGVYFLGNDRVRDLAIAFLNSFRKFNPRLPLCFIPYDDDCVLLEAMGKQYDFSVFPDRKLLKRFDRIGEMFHGREIGDYRKLAAWGGPFQSFIYIDSDTVVLSSLEFVYPLLQRYALLNAHSNLRHTRRHTWKDSIEGATLLTRAQTDYAANMGFIASRAGLFSLSHIEKTAVEALAVKEHMELHSTDQAFMNYLFVTSNEPFTSLHNLRKEYASIPHEAWAGDPDWYVVDADSVFYRGVREKVLFFHWAGQWKAKDGDCCCSSGQGWPTVSGISPAIRADMPQRNLWLYFRML